MTPADVIGSTIADAQRSNAISEMDLHEIVRATQRAIVFLDAGKYAQAMMLADTVANIARQAARRIEVAQAMRRTAESIEAAGRAK